MKNRFSKIFVAALAIALVLGATFALMASAETNPEIISNNIQYGEKFSIMYAVDADTVADGAVTLAIYTQTPAEGVDPVKTYTVAAPQTETIRGEEKSVYVFTTDGVRAQDFADVFYAQAIDATGKKSDVVSYSVVEYMLERLYGGQEISAKQEKLYKEAIDFGAAAQKLLASDDAIKVTDYKYVRVEGGTVNGVTGGMFMKGDKLTLALTATVPQGGFFFGWKNVNGEDANYSVNEFTLSESAVITADIDVNGTLGYFDRFGGYDMEDASTHWSWSEKNTVKIYRDGYTNGDKTDDAAMTVNNLCLDTENGNKSWKLVKGSGNGNLAMVYFLNLGSSDYIVAEADICFSDCAIVGNDKEYARFGISSGEPGVEVTQAGQVSLRAFKDGEKISYFSYFDMQLLPNQWYNVGWIYSKALGTVTYYLNGREVGSVNVANNTLDYSDSYIALTGEAKAAYVRIDNVYTGLDVAHLAESDEYVTFNDGTAPIVSRLENKGGNSSYSVVDLDGEKVLKFDKNPGGEDRLWLKVPTVENATKFVFETKMMVDVTTNNNYYIDFMNGSNPAGVYGIMLQSSKIYLTDFFNLSGVGGKHSFGDTTYFISGEQWINLKLVGYKNESDIWCVEYWINGQLLQTSTCAHWQGVSATDINGVRIRTFGSLDADIYFDDVKIQKIVE